MKKKRGEIMFKRLIRKNQDRNFVHFEGFHEERRREKNKQDNLLSRRIIVVLACSIILISVLSARLFYIQISRHNELEVKLQTYSVNYHTLNVPRGAIYDRNGIVLASTKNVIALYYSPPLKTDDDQKLLTAKILANNVSFDDSIITDREKKDYFIKAYSDDANKKITDDEKQKLSNNELSKDDIYKLKIERITAEDIARLTRDECRQYYIYYQMLQATKTVGKIILQNISEEDASFVAENNSILNGIMLIDDWDREYSYNSTFKQVLGNISTKQQGIPQELYDYYAALGYSANDRVGISGLEQQYQSLLSGTKSTYEIKYDENGSPYFNSITTGEKGNNLQLSIDIELQQLANNVLDRTIKNLGKSAGNSELSGIFFTMMDVNTGEVIVMSGLGYNNGETYDYAAGNYLSAFTIGSAAKGATIYTGFKYDVITPGEIINDAPMYIKDTPMKKSWNNFGPINDLQALYKSSNVYMFNIAIRLGGGKYIPNEALNINPIAFDKLRESFGELGLGVKTGIDVPYEELGYRGEDRQGGLLLDAAIGVYDTYTPIQVAQYAATLANGGNRVKPRLVTEAFTVENDEKITVYENPIEILDNVSQYQTGIERARLGFRLNVTQGLATVLAGKPYEVAGKSGTADIYINGVDYPNYSFVAFAPYSKPKVAISCIVPSVLKGSNPCYAVAGEIMDAYFNKYGVDK